MENLLLALAIAGAAFGFYGLKFLDGHILFEYGTLYHRKDTSPAVLWLVTISSITGFVISVVSVLAFLFV